MKVLGQRWEYRVGNSIVMVDNGFSWSLWAQERLVVNSETIQSAGGWCGLYRSFAEPWLSPLGEGELRVALKSRAEGIACSATLDGTPIVPEAYWVATWTGARGSWPGENEWIEAPSRSWIAR